ncbi:CPBP family intramembrane glutamic endopeptidase [Pseudomonas defluvii]|uniref:CPBP family intramembrane glutamic endopeptidase n=1 Tax=Pseudomonas defluvii TaxID=1876757 RepID=UPI003906027F
MPSPRGVALALLCLGYALALSQGQLTLAALPGLILLLCAAALVQRPRSRWLKACGHGLFVLLAAGLALHWLPGFNSAKVIDAQRLSTDAAPYSMYLNLDKPLIAFWILLACPWMLVGTRNTSTSVLAIASMTTVTAIACLGSAHLLGIVAWAPKWPTQGWLWVANNLLLVSLTEEVLFRGYIQGGVQHLLKHREHGQRLALLLAAGIFGLAHLGGGWQWVVLASIAGAGYGLVYRHGGLLAAVVSHFALNLLHFSLFTYPMLGK